MEEILQHVVNVPLLLTRFSTSQVVVLGISEPSTVSSILKAPFSSSRVFWDPRYRAKSSIQSAPKEASNFPRPFFGPPKSRLVWLSWFLYTLTPWKIHILKYVEPKVMEVDGSNDFPIQLGCVK